MLFHLPPFLMLISHSRPIFLSTCLQLSLLPTSSLPLSQTMQPFPAKQRSFGAPLSVLYKSIKRQIKNYQFISDIMSRANASTAKPATSSSKITKAVPTAWKDRLTHEDYEELVHTFQVFDEDGSGTIDPVEINKVLEELGLDKRNPFILNLINGLKEKNKPIGLDEFIDIIASRVGETKTKDGIRRVFALFDKDENGTVDFDEFKSIAKQLHDAINDDDIVQMMHSTHINQKTATNEGFTFEEFYTVVSKFNNK